MSEKLRSVVSSAVLEMSRLVRLAASPAVPGERVPHAIARAARRIGLAKGRAKSFWYGSARHVEPDELEAARQAAVERARDAELLRDEYRRALTILARLEARLTVVDADFHSESIAALRDSSGGEDRAGNSD